MAKSLVWILSVKFSLHFEFFFLKMPKYPPQVIIRHTTDDVATHFVPTNDLVEGKKKMSFGPAKRIQLKLLVKVRCRFEFIF